MTTTTSEPTTRMVFANELTVGSVIVEKCAGLFSNGSDGKCNVEVTAHHNGEWRHVLTVQRFRRGPRGVTAVVLDEDGNEQGWVAGGNSPTRVLAGCPVARIEDAEVLPRRWRRILGYAAGVAVILVPYVLGAATVLAVVMAGHAGRH